MSSLNTTSSCHGILHQLHNQAPQPLACATSPFVQVELTIILRLDIWRYYMDNSYSVNIMFEPLFSKQILRFDLHVFKNPIMARQFLSHFLLRFMNNHFHLGIDLNFVLDRIIRHGFKLANCSPVIGPILYRFSSIISGTIEEHQSIDYTEALEESLPEFDDDYCGMIPTKESSIKELERIRVKDGHENCMVCLEELEAGSYASRLPCCHVFHGLCLEKWLRQSHFCPICRFKMPTS